MRFEWKVAALVVATWLAAESIQAQGTGGDGLQNDRNFAEWKLQAFRAFDPHYDQDLETRVARARELGKKLIGREMAGQDTELSHRILSELIWLLSSTADFARIDQRLGDLQESLDHPEREALARRPDPKTGGWEQGCTEWFFVLIASYSHFGEAGASNFRFLDRINSPEKLAAYLDSVSVSDIARTGIDHERELNESLSYIVRMILRGEPRGYAWDPRLKDVLMDYLQNRLRNRVTGYWGERYLVNGQERFVDDLSMTFHIVSYLKGKVDGMDKVVTTTLAALDAEFPTGPIYNGQRSNHMNMDVAEIFRPGLAPCHPGAAADHRGSHQKHA